MLTLRLKQNCLQDLSVARLSAVLPFTLFCTFLCGLFCAGVIGCRDGRADDKQDATTHEDGGVDGGDDALVEQDADLIEVKIIHTSDEHGWLEEDKGNPPWVYGGAANVFSWWVEKEGFDRENHILLSSGDTWTGPALSTWFYGEPVVEAFNLMGYHGVAVGNHEFDFGIDVLMERIEDAEFPFLSANIYYKSTGERLEGVEPWVMLDRAGVKVGVVGLTTTTTATSGHSMHVADLFFEEYTETLDEIVPVMRDEGARVVVVLAHVCESGLSEAIGQIGVDVDLALAGHCHDFYVDDANGVPVVSSGYHFRGYSVIILEYSWSQEAVVSVRVEQQIVVYSEENENPVTPDAEIEGLVDYWRALVDEDLQVEVGWTVSGIVNPSWLQGNWVVDSWLWAFPQAEVALTNFGGIRRSIPPGVFTVEDIVGMLPFDNDIYLIEITGAELVENLEAVIPTRSPAVGGMKYMADGNSVSVMLEGGVPLDPDEIYRVLVTDFLYFGGDGYLFHLQDPDPINLLTHYRQPVIDRTSSLNTSKEDPIENYIDSSPRNVY